MLTQLMLQEITVFLGRNAHLKDITRHLEFNVNFTITEKVNLVPALTML